MTDGLGEYKRKRHFDLTDEPSGKTPRRRARRLRFVVQHHIATRDHYDFRLEWEGVLKSWAVPKGPSYDSREKRLAVQVEDHPLEYRGFEGTIPKGQYGGGVVMIWDQGYWQPEGDAGAGLEAGTLKFALDGDRLQGRWALVRMKAKPGEKNTNWLLIKEKDEYDNVFDLKQLTTSSKTGRTMEEIEQGAGLEPGGEKARPPKQARGSAPPAGPSGKAIAEARDIPITHPDKILFTHPPITKGEIAEYYAAVAKRMLPHVERRILSVVRCPSGTEKGCFYKKHPGHDSRGVVTVSVPGSDAEAGAYFYVTDARGLLSEIQMNTLEFHTWGSRVETLENPDVMVFDLDPDEGMEPDRIRQGVKDLKSLLQRLSLTPYLKTSGGKGYHVVVPFRPAANWTVFHDFAENTAKTMEAMWPDRYTANVRKDRRKNRIFIDWMRNGRGATSIAPYSVRARQGASVSLPIAWEELDSVSPNGISMREAILRLDREDPWAGFFKTRRTLK